MPMLNNNQNNLDKYKKRNGPSNIYDAKQLKLLVNYEWCSMLKMLHH